MIYWNEKEKLCVNHFRGLKGLISHSVELEILCFFIVTSVNKLSAYQYQRYSGLLRKKFKCKMSKKKCFFLLNCITAPLQKMWKDFLWQVLQL